MKAMLGIRACIISLTLMGLMGMSACSNSKNGRDAAPLIPPPVPSEPTPTPASASEATASPASPKSSETSPTPASIDAELAVQMAKTPCPFGLDESHEARELAVAGIKVTFACNSMKSSDFYPDWKQARDSYPKAIALLAKNKSVLTGAKRPPRIIELDYLNEPSARTVTEANEIQWRVNLKLTEVETSLEKNLAYYMALDQTYGAYELKYFPKLTVFVEFPARERDMTKGQADRSFRVVKDALDMNRNELRTLSERGLRALRFDSDYRLELKPHRLSIKNGDALTSIKTFISDFPLRNFFAQNPGFHVDLAAGAGYESRRDLSRDAAKLFAKSIPALLSATQNLKTKEVHEMKLYLIKGIEPLDRANQIQFYHHKLDIHMISPDGVRPAEIEKVIRQIKDLDQLSLY